MIELRELILLAFICGIAALNSGCNQDARRTFDEEEELRIVLALSKANPNLGAQRDCRGQTLVHHAAINNHLRVAAHLVELGGNGLQSDFQGNTPVMLCAESKATQVARLLIKHRNFRSPTVRELSAAINHQNMEIVDLLIRAGVNVNARADEMPPLLEAAEALDTEHLSSVSILNAIVTAGAEVNVVDGSESSPLHIAARSGVADAVKILLASGANVNAVDDKNYTPIHDCSSPEIAKLLAAAGANLEAEGLNGKTPLDLAIIFQHVELTQTLRELGAKDRMQNANN